mgnify:FL=1
MREAYAYAVSLIQAGYTVDEAGDAASIQHGLDEFQEDDVTRRLNRFFAPDVSKKTLTPIKSTS